ncbi:GDSL esterase/lipase At5g03980 [Solanum lycopersicum]|uniref:GDSL esterase/lipase At5g03980 n=1 Tax=Solanum lycopersicum TaxID=4081 RepID=UPI0002768B67|nr:GDSL esterase/lipase At5g03980 isoform X1 [Solanum lycopersicum]
MAFTIRVAVLHLLILEITIISSLFLQANAQELLIKLEEPKLKKCGINRIYQFGDSLSDTGNCLRESYCGAHTGCRFPPYGMNFYQKEITGRCSNGLLMVDFMALECGLPLLNPSLEENANFSQGSNFAVAGATALSVEQLAERNISMSYTNSTLTVQLHWMSSHFNSICSTDCPKYLEKSLFLVGEIGGDELAYGFIQGKTIQELRTMVPDIVHAIIRGVTRVISFGATRIVVPGNIPAGCNPVILTIFGTTYDEYGCVKEWNNFMMYYNNHLKRGVYMLKREYPNISISYGDYYNAYLWLRQNVVALGFDKNSVLKACCGIGGEYNYRADMRCGNPGVKACADPNSYISWDGIHLTQRAYSWLTKWLIDDIIPQLNCLV